MQWSFWEESDGKGVSINMGIKWRLLYRLRSMRHFFMNTIIAVFQFTNLILKKPGLEIFKMRANIFVSSKLTEILQNLYKFQFIYWIKIVLISNIFVNFWNRRKVEKTYNLVFILSLPCTKYQKSKATFKLSLNTDVNWDTLYEYRFRPDMSVDISPSVSSFQKKDES